LNGSDSVDDGSGAAATRVAATGHGGGSSVRPPRKTNHSRRGKGRDRARKEEAQKLSRIRKNRQTKQLICLTKLRMRQQKHKSLVQVVTARLAAAIKMNDIVKIAELDNQLEQLQKAIIDEEDSSDKENSDRAYEDEEEGSKEYEEKGVAHDEEEDPVNKTKKEDVGSSPGDNRLPVFEPD
jgi:hypothetical protein